jgi:hypothetical protein
MPISENTWQKMPPISGTHNILYRKSMLAFKPAKVFVEGVKSKVSVK